MRACWSSLCVLLLVSGAAEGADRFEEVRSAIRAGLIEQHVPSIAVAVAQNGRIVWEEGFGWADREKRIVATEHTMYSLASISKPVTATGLMTLVQAGKIDLERPINEYLGSAKLRARVGDVNAATVRRVANHTSGLPLHYQFFYVDEPYRAPSRDETILRYGNLVTAPGEIFEYSNLGYGVLDYVIERVSGRSYADFMRQEVFEPLGMTRTSVDIGPGLEPYAAARYADDGTPIPFYGFDHPGGSAVYSSAHDLVRFGLFHAKAHLRDQKAILSDASLEEMHRPTADRAPNYWYGIGFGVRDKDGYHLVSHGGSMGGVTTLLSVFPREKLVVVVLSNSSNKLTAQISDLITTRLLPKWKPFPPETDSRPAPFAASSSLLGTWKGTLSTYVKDLPVELSFLPSGDVHAKFGNQLVALVNDPKFEDGVFSGVLNAHIGTPDTERYEYNVGLKLRLRGDVLNGSATSLDVDGPRVRNALTHWVELKKP